MKALSNFVLRVSTSTVNLTDTIGVLAGFNEEIGFNCHIPCKGTEALSSKLDLYSRF
jgi:hypothetical protein